MEDGTLGTLLLRNVRRWGITGAMAGSLFLAAAASAFADTSTSAKSVANGSNPTSGDASNTTSITKDVTTTGGLATTTSSPNVTGATNVGNTHATSTPVAQSGNQATTHVDQRQFAQGGTNTNIPSTELSSSSCFATNNASNSQVTTRKGEDQGSSGANTHQPSATCNHSLGQTDVKQSAKGKATGPNVTLTNTSDSSAKTDSSAAGAKVAADGKAKVADSGAGATTYTGSNGANGSSTDSAKAESKAKSAGGSDTNGSSAQSGNATVDFTKDTTVHTTGGDANATSNPTATYSSTVGDTTVHSEPTAVSWNWNGINITCYPTAYGGTNTNTLSTHLTGTATNNADGSTQESNREGFGSGSSGSNTYKPEAKVDQRSGHTKVHQYADANASCGTINISNTFTSTATTGPSEAKADVSATGKAEIRNSGAAATSVTNGSAHDEAGGGSRTAIITSGGSTNLAALSRDDLASVNVADSHNEGVQIITSGGSTNITRTLRMGVQAVNVASPPTTAAGVQAIVPELATTGGSRGLWAGETGSQPALPFVLGLIACGYGIAWLGRRLLSRN